jgi:hypothetical protein
MDEATFAEGMQYMAEAFGLELTEGRAAVYWDQLRGAPGEYFRAAARRIVAADHRFPTVARIREAVRTVARDDLERQKDANAGARKIGRGASVDKATAKARLAEIRARLSEGQG